MTTDTPFIPENITVHLGSPDSIAENVTLPFADYIKNVASSEIYPTWPENAIRANILAQISFTLNRVYTEFYKSRGYDFDITNSTASDQSFVDGRDIFENISQIVDEVFTTYIRRQGNVEPLFAAYCDGDKVTCNGLSQWGSVTLAERGYSPVGILRYYYGDDIELVENTPVLGEFESYPDRILSMGSAGNDVRDIQVRLNRISKNYPSIPKIPQNDGIFGTETENAVKAFQRIFFLDDDGIVGRATWYSIARVYTAVKRLSEVYSEGISNEEIADIFATSLNEGDSGVAVRELQYFLSLISLFNANVESTRIDGYYGENTANALTSFQIAYGLPQTEGVTPQLWDEIYSVYRGILDVIPQSYFRDDIVVYPGFPIRLGSEGDAVRTIQEYLNYISRTYTEIPTLTVDGIFGQGTTAAVRAYQTLFGLTPNGVVGSVTWNSVLDTYTELSDSAARNEGQFGQ